MEKNPLNQALMTLYKIEPSFIVSKLEFDSRNIEENDIFVPLKGNRDGHIFIEDAIKNGARVVLYSNKRFNLKKAYKNVLFIQVEDTLKAMENIGKKVREIVSPVVIGITGTSGKTTTKELVYHILSRKYKTQRTRGNYNNHIGVPYELSNLGEDTEIAVVEMGMNHLGEIRHLSSIASPEISIITSIGEGHIGFLGDIKTIAKAKSEIMEGMFGKKLLLICRDLNQKEIVLERAKELKINVIPIDCSEFKIKKMTPFETIFYIPRYKTEFRTKLFGSFNIRNAIMSIYLAKEVFSVDIETVKSALWDFSPIKGRMNVIKLKDDIILFDDAYNSNPLSLRESLSSFSAIDGDGRKIAIVGDMLELGELSEKYHIEALRLLDSLPIDVKIVYGNEFQSAKKKTSTNTGIILYEDMEDIKKWLEENIKEKDRIFIKASNGVGLHKLSDFIVESLK